MSSPTPCFQRDDPPLRGNPRLYGDMSGLKGNPTSTFRRRHLSDAKARQLHVYLIIAACHDAKMSSKIVADVLGYSERHVLRIYALKVRAQGERHA